MRYQKPLDSSLTFCCVKCKKIYFVSMNQNIDDDEESEEEGVFFSDFKNAKHIDHTPLIKSSKNDICGYCSNLCKNAQLQSYIAMNATYAIKSL